MIEKSINISIKLGKIQLKLLEKLRNLFSKKDKSVENDEQAAPYKIEPPIVRKKRTVKNTVTNPRVAIKKTVAKKKAATKKTTKSTLTKKANKQAP